MKTGVSCLTLTGGLDPSSLCQVVEERNTSCSKQLVADIGPHIDASSRCRCQEASLLLNDVAEELGVNLCP